MIKLNLFLLDVSIRPNIYINIFYNVEILFDYRSSNMEQVLYGLTEDGAMNTSITPLVQHTFTVKSI